jgi:2-polyprenyl-3-methyl-5-hydroxy-6-metoxy-1,4-benzoquinol methylase
MKKSKELVQEYWDRYPCDSTELAFLEGSLKFFEEMEERRYLHQVCIHAFAQFTRWRGKKVLEVGYGCGTDLLQFARAGAEAYGIDLSEHSVELTRKRLELYELQAEVTQDEGEYLVKEVVGR